MLIALATTAIWTLSVAGIATATELFQGSETLKAGTTIHASLTGSTTLESTDGTLVDTCTGGGLEGATTNTGGEGEAVGLEVVSLTWSGCSFTTDTLSNGSLSISQTGGLDGTVSGAGTTWTVKYAVSCRYGTGAGTTLGTVTGTSDTGKHATIDINATLSEQEPKSAFCPDSVAWKASYTVTSPTGLNVGPLPETELFSGSTALEKGATFDASLKSGSSAVLTDTSGGLTDTCEESTASGNTANTAGAQVSINLEALTWGECTWATTTLSTGNISVTNKGSGNGTVSGSESVVTVKAFNLVDCFYGTAGGTHLGTLDGVKEGHATLTVNAVINEQEPKKALCPDTTFWQALYTITTPTGLNVGP